MFLREAWFSLCKFGFLGEDWGSLGYLLGSLECLGTPWVSMGLFGVLLAPLGSYEVLGEPWCSLGRLEVPYGCLGFLRVS